MKEGIYQKENHHFGTSVIHATTSSFEVCLKLNQGAKRLFIEHSPSCNSREHTDGPHLVIDLAALKRIVKILENRDA